MTSIEIKMLTPEHGDGGHTFKRFPCIQVLVSSPDSEDPNMMKLVWALIDTGADHIFVDTAFILQEGANPLSTRQVNVSNTEMIFDATIAVPPFVAPTTIQVCGYDMVGKKLPYRMILGRQFLEGFRLEYDPANGIRRLSPSRPLELQPVLP